MFKRILAFGAAAVLLSACGGGGAAPSAAPASSAAPKPASAAASVKPAASAAASASAKPAASASAKPAASAAAASAKPAASAASGAASASAVPETPASASARASAAPTPVTQVPLSQAKLATPLPATIQQRGKLVTGVKCDYPPFGFIDQDGKNAGYEIDLVKQMAIFGFGNENATQMECVVAANRIPFLTTNRIDLIVATVTYTLDRAKTINFSDPYFAAAGRMLLPKSSNITDEKQLKNVAVPKGSVYVTWFQKCSPNTNLLQFEQTSEGLAMLSQGRAEAFVHDDTLLIDLAAKNQNLKIVGNGIAPGPWGMGIRLNDKAMTDWVNSALKQMQSEDLFFKLLQKWVADKDAVAKFDKTIPRPNQNLTYPTTDQFTC
jgi:polar amino acid transport system substrate-binding protein